MTARHRSMARGRGAQRDGWTQRAAQREAQRLGATQVFRPRLGMFVAVFVGLVALVWLGAAAWQYGWRAAYQLPLIAGVVLLAYLTCVRPIVAIFADGVLVRNVTRDVRIPWGALAEVSTQYALTLTTTGGLTVRAWAAPAPSRFSATRATASDLEAIGWDGDDGPPPASAHLGSDSGTAAIMVRRGWAAARESNDTDTEVTVRWAWGWFAAVLGIAALAALALTLG